MENNEICFTMCYNQIHQTLSDEFERMSYMQENIYNNNYFFVDESEDTTFYNRKGEWIVGNENGASKILLMGFIRTTEPEFLRKNLMS